MKRLNLIGFLIVIAFITSCSTSKKAIVRSEHHPIEVASSVIKKGDKAAILASFSFDNERLKALESMGMYDFSLSSEECVRILKIFSFDNDRLKAAKIILPVMKDLENLDDILASFSFDNDRSKSLLSLNTSGKSLSSEACVGILKIFSFDNDRLKAAKVILPIMKDFDNLDDILASFSFDNDRSKSLLSLNTSGKSLSSEACVDILKIFSFDNDRLKAAKVILPIMKDFDNLTDILASFSFDNDRSKALLSLEASGLSLSSKECVNILKVFSFDNDRLKAAKILFPRLKDHKEIEDALALFSFDRDKGEVISMMK